MEKSYFSKGKVINWIIDLIFLLFALVQFNDPDPLIWVLIYGLVAVVAVLTHFVRVPKILIQSLILAMVVFALFHIGHFYDWLLGNDKSDLFGGMIPHRPYLEGTREFLGLLLAVGTLWYLLKNQSKNAA